MIIIDSVRYLRQGKQKGADMKRVTDVDAILRCKKFDTALNRFMKKYPGHEECREVYEWMHETGTEFFADTLMADGSKNNDWCYALHCEAGEDWYYLALVERA